MKALLNVLVVIALVSFFLTGCETVNRGLDKANEGAREVGKPVGKVMSIPGSAAEGAAEGMITSEDDENPYNR